MSILILTPDYPLYMVVLEHNICKIIELYNETIKKYK